MLEPFPGLTEEDRAVLTESLEPWRGDIDPDRDLWEAQREHPDLRIEDSEIVVLTDPVVIRYRGKDYQLGRYVLRVPLVPSRAEYTTIRCQTRRGGAQHPHVNRHGEPCFGEATWPFLRALRQGRYGDAITVLKSMLRGYNPNSPISHLENWTPLDEGLHP